MPDFPKATDLFRVFRDEAVSRSNRLTVNAVDRDGSDANIIGYASAVVGEEVIGQLADVEEAFWLDSTRKKKLDKWAWDRYRMLRKPASAAFTYATFTTTNAAAAAFTIPVNTKSATSDGREFMTIASIAFPFGSVGPLRVIVRSTLAGLDQNIEAGALKSITSQIVGAPVDLAVTNEEAAGGGDGVEGDDDFKARIKKFWLAARRGTKGAIETGALDVPGVLRAVAIEGLQTYGYPTRSLQLVIADRFTDALVKQGVASPTYETQSQALAQAVGQALAEYRGYGVPVKVIVAQVVLVGVALRLKFRASVTDTDALALYARSLVAQYINSLNPGVTFDPIIIPAILQSLSGLDVTGDEVASPVGAIVPQSPFQALRSSLALVTVDSQATLQSQALTT